ncbi:MAG: hypothetical protein HQ579_01700 [Candidatus Omnitrophica bacterium]|nr:hypothetical protein [Candidatus Omnitrophota bacterium]
MTYPIIIKTVALIELLIGSITLFSLATYPALSISRKPLNVFTFVLISSLTSILVGLGLFNYKEWARKTLIFFSGYIILTKIMIFLNLLQFTGEIVIFIPTGLKNSTSIFYHGLIVLFFNRAIVKESFKK